MFVISTPQSLDPSTKYYWADDRWITEAKYARPFVCMSEATGYVERNRDIFDSYAGEVSIDWLDRTSIDIVTLAGELKEI